MSIPAEIINIEGQTKTSKLLAVTILIELNFFLLSKVKMFVSLSALEFFFL